MVFLLLFLLFKYAVYVAQKCLICFQLNEMLLKTPQISTEISVLTKITWMPNKCLCESCSLWFLTSCAVVLVTLAAPLLNPLNSAVCISYCGNAKYIWGSWAWYIWQKVSWNCTKMLAVSRLTWRESGEFVFMVWAGQGLQNIKRIRMKWQDRRWKLRKWCLFEVLFVRNFIIIPRIDIYYCTLSLSFCLM